MELSSFAVVRAIMKYGDVEIFKQQSIEAVILELPQTKCLSNSTLTKKFSKKMALIGPLSLSAIVVPYFNISEFVKRKY